MKGRKRGINMVVMKMMHMKHIPEYCDDCIYYGCKPHPYKGWADSCELCMQCLDDDQEKGWIYDGNGRPTNCPLMEVDDSQAESEDCISKKAVLDKINQVCFSRDKESVDFRVTQGSNGQRDLIINFIENLPSVHSKPKVLDKIRAEIDCQEKWLMSAGCNAYNVDIAFNSIRSVLSESEDKE